MRALALLPVCMLLSGCYVALHGHQTNGPAGTTSTVASVTRGHASVGSARASASFGAPSPASGGRVAVSSGATVVLVIAVVVAEVLNYFSATARTPAMRQSIADTCSCYGYRPAPPSPAQAAEE